MSQIDGVAPFILQIHFGKDYRFLPVGPLEGKLYRPFCVAWHARRCQEEVVYCGITGPDRHRWLACTLDDWATRFELVQEPQPEVPDRGAAGYES